MRYHHEHIWIEGPEIPLRYGTCLSRVCTECGKTQEYDWHGNHRDYAWSWDIHEYLERCAEDDL